MRMNVSDIREYFKNELEAERFTVDRTGSKTIEMLGASFVADEPAIFGTVNQDYVDAEIRWYLSESTNINDIHEDKEPPAAWKYTANKHGEINSNYGHLIFSPKYGQQFDRAVDELINNQDSRRAVMVYNRPSIWDEFNENGKNDFICTNAVAYYIRDGKLHACVQMRSNDVVFGYKNDFAWAKWVLCAILNEYNDLVQYSHRDSFQQLEAGNIYWQVQNLHVYERHFHLVK